MALLSWRRVWRIALVCPPLVLLACDESNRLCFCGDDTVDIPRDGGPQFAPAFDAGAKPPPRDVEVADAEVTAPDASAASDSSSSSD